MRETRIFFAVLLGTTLFSIALAARATELIFRKTTSTTTEAGALGEDSIADNETISSQDDEKNNGTSDGKPKLTGIPQIDYVHDPNLPRELNGYNLSSYPFLESVPPEDEMDFVCDGLHDGFYASVKWNCQLYHHCLFGVRYDFLCANFTAFDQKTFICHFASEVDCKNSPRYFYRNDALYKQSTTTPVPTTTTTTTARTTTAPPEPPKRQRPYRRRPVVYDDYYYDDEVEERPLRQRRPVVRDYDYEYEDLPRRPYQRTRKVNNGRRKAPIKTRRRIPAYYDDEEEVEPAVVTPKNRENTSVLDNRRKPATADDRGKDRYGSDERSRPNERRHQTQSEERTRPSESRYRNDDDRYRQSEERYRDDGYKPESRDRNRQSQGDPPPQAVPKVKELSDKNYNIYTQPRAVTKFTPKLFKPNRLTTTVPEVVVDVRKPSDRQPLEKSNYSSEKYEKQQRPFLEEATAPPPATSKTAKFTEPPTEEEYSYEEYYEDELDTKKEVVPAKKQPVDISIEKSYKRPLIISRGKY